MNAAERAVLELSREERLRLIEKLWESLVEEDEQLEISEEVKAELDRRRAAHRENPGEALSWAEVKRTVRGEV